MMKFGKNQGSGRWSGIPVYAFMCSLLFGQGINAQVDEVTPSRNDREAFTKLSEEQRAEFRDFIRDLVERTPEMSREERGVIIRNALQEISDDAPLTGENFEDVRPEVISLWEKGKMPGPAPLVKGQERDTSTDESKLIAGKPLIRLGNVSEPEITIYRPRSFLKTDAAVIICPGGGFHILASDLEGSEVAEWSVKQGVTAVVLKYRVPTAGHGDELIPAPNNPDFKIPKKALGPVMDTQRAIERVRLKAEELEIDPEKIGLMGFSAGGQTAALAANAQGLPVFERGPDEPAVSFSPGFLMLIYPGGLADAESGELKAFAKPNGQTPPAFLVHAADDRVTCHSSIALFSAMKLQGLSAELHVFEKGGHGYGLRRTEEPVTGWTVLAESWLQNRGLGKPLRAKSENAGKKED